MCPAVDVRVWHDKPRARPFRREFALVHATGHARRVLRLSIRIGNRRGLTDADYASDR